MIFEQLTLKDFRQFSGEQSITFATDPQKNVTVIHGFNGAGKTTLLNAFTWLLYGEFSPDFDAPEHIESEAAFAVLKPNARLMVWVKAIFRDGVRKYTAERVATIEKDAHGTRRVVASGTLRLMYIDDSGEAIEPNNPQDTLEQMLPTRLYPFFFFNGERIERLARADAYQEIGQGIRTLLDIELFDRAIQHLEGEPARRLRQDIAQRAGQEGQIAQDELNHLTESREEVEEKLRQAEVNRAALEDEREAIDAKIATMPDLAKWQAERKAAEDKESALLLQIKQRKTELAKEFSRNAFLLLAPDVLKEAKILLEAARQKGEIPGPIKRQFVEDLLIRGKCICGSNLTPGSKEYEDVDQWRQRCLSDAMEASVTVTQARLDAFDQRISDYSQRVQDIQRIRDDLQTQLQRTREELSELSVKIGNREHGEDPAKLERRRREIIEEITTLRLNMEMKRAELANINEGIRAKIRQIESLQLADEEGKLAQRRLDAVSNVVEVLRQIREIRFAEIRDDLSVLLSDVWGGIAIKDYQARLDDGFCLRLTKEIDGQEEPVRGASTGEKQVLSLAFVGALSAKARSTFERSGQAKNLFRGGLYPLVIDSAFGNLEIEYRRDVAKWIPNLSPQVILLVSESQFRDEVAHELLPRIGVEWILKCETRKNTSKDITVRGRKYPYVIQSNDKYERTTFEEVEL